MDAESLANSPISESNPAGDDIRHSETFEALQSQIDRLSMVSAEGAVIDWEQVEKLGTAILSNQSKNIQVAAYLAVALQEQHALQGLADGVKLVRALTETFWETMYPPKRRLRGRLNAYAWWKERTVGFLKDYQYDEPQPKELVDGLTEDVSALNDALGEKSEDAPTLRDLLEQIHRIPVLEPEPEPEPQSESTPESGSQPDSAPPTQSQANAGQQQPRAAPPPPGNVSSLDETAAEGLFKQGMEQLYGYQQWQRQHQPGHPLIFRITRWSAWGGINILPPAEGAATHLPPPEDEIKSSLEQLLAQGNFQQAVNEAESRVPQFLFWLDLSRISAKALEGLGANFANALRAVEMETWLFVQRLEGIEQLTFSDGTPFCNEDTQAWLTTLAPGDGGGAQTDAVDQAASEARKKAAGQDLLGALASLDKAMQAEGRLRNRFRLQVTMLKLLAQAASPELSAAYCQDLITVIDEHKLDEWEPELALAGLSAAYGALQTPTEGSATALAQQIFARMGRISPAHALRMAGPAGT